MTDIFFNNNYINGWDVDQTIANLCDFDTTPNERKMVEMLAKHHEAFDFVDYRLTESNNISQQLRNEIIANKCEFDYFKSTIENKISFIDKLFETINSNPVLQTEWERFLVMLKLSVETQK